MTPYRLAMVLLAAALLLADGAWSAHTGGGPDTQERVALENDTVKIGYLVYLPGGSSGIHLNPEPEIAIIVEGELTMVTRKGKQVHKPGSVIYLETGSGHIAMNESKSPVKFWALNLKKCD
ncbi:MAG TPA: cupin domain-containing protein [Candidatus Nitrosocosmicus sp.]|jgi:quercetin dioxygenase-like cupin family protein|nr:cupin domain-containing protein [Candidatus Nitrosocosmicus sp.]